MEHVTVYHPLDWGMHYYLILDYDPDRAIMSGFIVSPVNSTKVVERHLATLVAVTVNEKKCRLILNETGVPSFSTAIPTKGDVKVNIHLGGSDQKKGDLYGHYLLDDKGVLSGETPHRLTVFETRMLSNEKLYRWLPYKRGILIPPFQATDLHTHSSGQISAQGLIDIAIKHKIAYPTRLLELLHIEYAHDEVVVTRRFFFPPTDGGNPDAIPKEESAVPIASLNNDEREKLKVALSLPPDRQMTFGDLEQTIYRYRYPITKHPDVAYDLWLKVAQEYQRQGVSYAEVTAVSTSFLTPQHLAFLHDALPRIEQETGVKLRFLVGIPRNLPPEMLGREGEKLKLMGASPYIVGIDFMGFEDNKISELEPYIKAIAEWARDYDPEFTLRIHAGENRKNMDNVKESLRIAEKYHMRVRIGHAAHGLDDEAIAIAEKLAGKKLVMIEFNPDSNLALNNIDTAEELDMTRCINKGIPFVICSDGGGLYQTDVQQLWLAASFAGVKHAEFASILQSEREHVEREEKRFTKKMQMLPPDFLDRLSAQFKTMPPLQKTARTSGHSFEAFAQHMQVLDIEYTPESIAMATRGKTPLLILGATGNRYWNVISEPHQKQIRKAITMLVKQLDPKKMYFLIGRPKDEGLTALLSREVQNYNASHAEKFALVSATVQADQTTHSFTPGLTHVLPLHGSLFTVPDQLVGHVADASGGHIIFIGGGTFVRDAILIARDKKVSFGLMRGPEGASTDKAVMMDPMRQFTDADGLITHLYHAHPGWFTAPLSNKKRRAPSSVPLGLRIIGTMKLATATVLALGSFGVFRLINQDVGEVLENYAMRLHLDPENHFINSVMESVAGFDQNHLKAIGFGTSFYALLYVVEGVGLLLAKHWAEYLVIIITGSLLPLELYELLQKLSAMRVTVLLINVIIVVYLLRQVRTKRRSRNAQK